MSCSAWQATFLIVGAAFGWMFCWWGFDMDFQRLRREKRAAQADADWWKMTASLYGADTERLQQRRDDEDRSD